MLRGDLPKRIIEFLQKQEWPATTETVAVELNISWNTAQVHLLKLMAEGKVKYRKVGRQNQFWLNKNYEKEME
jgi:predicted ArsR family transcriptional regulator